MGPGLLNSATAPGIGSLLPNLTTIPSIEAEAACCGKECRGEATQNANTAITSLLIGNLQRQWRCSDAVKAGTEGRTHPKRKRFHEKSLPGLIFQREAPHRYVCPDGLMLSEQKKSDSGIVPVRSPTLKGKNPRIRQPELPILDSRWAKYFKRITWAFGTLPAMGWRRFGTTGLPGCAHLLVS